MKRIIIFRFHKYPKVCADRLRLLRKYNPQVPIFGLYGGRPGGLPEFKDAVWNYFEGVYSVEDESDIWKWKHGDLSLRRWFAAVGKDVDFEMLNVIEWDLLMLGSLDDMYRGIARNSIGLTALTNLENVENRWVWTSHEPYRAQWLSLLDYVKNAYRYSATPSASLGPGYCLPRSFLEKYCSIDVPELCHDELRLPLFGQILGFDLCDTGFCKKWFDDDERQFFNCENILINYDTIIDELKKDNGRRAFHPYRLPEVFKKRGWLI